MNISSSCRRDKNMTHRQSHLNSLALEVSQCAAGRIISRFSESMCIKKKLHRRFFYNMFVVYDVQNVKAVNLAHGDTPKVNF